MVAITKEKGGVPMTSRLAGQVAVVTGASKGIGRCIAETLAAERVRVVGIDLKPPQDDSASACYQELFLGDVSDRDVIREIVRRTVAAEGRIDILVNNAGMDLLCPDTWNMDDDSWSRVIDVNLNGTWWVTSAVVPTMISQGSGRIVFIGSISCRNWGFGIGNSPAYKASKAGLIGLVLALSGQLERHGILVNGINAGPTGNTGTLPTEEERHAYLASHPLGYGGPEPIAAAVRYLVDSSGDWITGAMMNVSGGEIRGL